MVRTSTADPVGVTVRRIRYNCMGMIAHPYVLVWIRREKMSQGRLIALEDETTSYLSPPPAESWGKGNNRDEYRTEGQE